MTISEAKPGMHVRYVPGVAQGDPTHPACEDGVVSTVGRDVIFVKFNLFASHGTACSPEDLVKL